MGWRLCALAISGVLAVTACTDHPDGFHARHLGEYGLGLTLLVPDSAEIRVKDYGAMRDITIRDGADFYLQIFEFQSPTGDSAGEKLRQLNTARRDPFFREVIREDEHGFIYSKLVDTATVDYDFRYIRMLGEQELIFQTGLTGTYSLEAVSRMYLSASGAFLSAD